MTLSRGAHLMTTTCRTVHPRSAIINPPYHKRLGLNISDIQKNSSATRQEAGNAHLASSTEPRLQGLHKRDQIAFLLCG